MSHLIGSPADRIAGLIAVKFPLQICPTKERNVPSGKNNVYKSAHSYVQLFICSICFDLHYRGSDQTPSSSQTQKQAVSSEGIPKSVARVLHAAQVRQEWREKKRKFESGEDTGEHGGKGKRRRVDGNTNTKDKVKVKGHHDTKESNVMAIKPGESLGHFNRCVFSIPSTLL